MTCTTTRHDANDYQNGLCRCETGRAAHRLRYKLRQRGLAPVRFVSNVGTRRRVEGLLALGWTGVHIATAAGLPRNKRPSQIGGDPRSTRVTVETARAVRRAAAKLGGTPGPSAITRVQARRLGYVSLWAWNDDIDNPAAQPEGAVRGPKPMPKLTPSLTARFTQHAVPTLGSPHVRWTGPTDKTGRGKLAYGAQGHRTTVSARRIAFVLHRRREPQGPVVPGCGNGWWVDAAPPHRCPGAGRHPQDRGGPLAGDRPAGPRADRSPDAQRARRTPHRRAGRVMANRIEHGNADSHGLVSIPFGIDRIGVGP